MTTKQKREIISLLQEQIENVLLLYSVEEAALNGSLINFPDEFSKLGLSEEFDSKIIGFAVKTIQTKTESAEKMLDNIMKNWRTVRKGKPQ